MSLRKTSQCRKIVQIKLYELIVYMQIRYYFFQLTTQFIAYYFGLFHITCLFHDLNWLFCKNVIRMVPFHYTEVRIYIFGIIICCHLQDNFTYQAKYSYARIFQFYLFETLLDRCYSTKFVYNNLIWGCTSFLCLDCGF